MCGLFGGVTNNFNQNEKEIVFSLACLNVVRGMDSSGFCSVYEHKGKNVFSVRKSLAIAPELMLTSFNESGSKALSPYGSFLDSSTNARMFMGHCRAATQGAVNKANSHPFLHGDIVGMHNGTCRHLTPVVPKDYQGASSDSNEIVKLLNTKSVQEVYDTCSEKDGAFALVWFNVKDSTLNFVRNDKRTLFYYEGACIYWSSEKEALKYAISRKGNCVEAHLKPFNTNTHYSIKVDGSIPKMLKTPLKEEKNKPTFYGGGTMMSGHHMSSAQSWEEVFNTPTSASSSSVPVIPAAPTTTQQPVVPPPPSSQTIFTHQVFFGDMAVPISLVNRASEGSCFHCTNKINHQEVNSWVMFNHTEFAGNPEKRTISSLLDGICCLCDECVQSEVHTKAYNLEDSCLIRSFPVYRKNTLNLPSPNPKLN